MISLEFIIKNEDNPYTKVKNIKVYRSGVIEELLSLKKLLLIYFN